MSTKNNNAWIILVVIIGIFSISILSSVLSPTKRTLSKLKSAMDIQNPITRNFTLKLASQYPGEYNIDQVCKIYEHVYKNWKYVNDPRDIDYYSKASYTILNNLTGDCDDFAILIATAIESIGGKTRISYAFDSNSKIAHAFTEVYFNEDSNKIRERVNYYFQNFFEVLFEIPRVREISYSPDRARGLWLNLDWNSKYPGGPYFKYTSRIIFYPRQNYFLKEK
jgi:hypothetical protein